MHQPCRTCPFRENPVEAGSPEWLIDLMKGLIRKELDHSCHLTDRKADLVQGEARQKGKKRPCIGFLGMMKRCGGQGIGRKAWIALASGEIDWDKLPTKGVFAHPNDAVRFHGRAIGLEFGEDGKPLPGKVSAAKQTNPLPSPEPPATS